MSLESYNDLLTYVDNKITDIFVDIFKNSDGNKCTSQSQYIINQTLNLKGTFKGCNFDMSSRIDQSSSDRLCLDVNEKLKFMSKTERENIFSQICNRLTLELSSLLYNKQTFVDKFIDRLKIKLENIDSSSQFKCVQTSITANDQQVTISGNMTCDSSSKIKISSAIFAQQSIKCMSKPVIDTLKEDRTLANLFLQDDNMPCVYDLELTKKCDGDTQEYRVSIIKPAKGTGTCDYEQDQTILQPCYLDTCIVGEWGEWSQCYDDNGTQKKYRSRKIERKGTDCEQYRLREESTCIENKSLSSSRKIMKFSLLNMSSISYTQIFLLIFVIILMIVALYCVLYKSK